MLWSNAEIANGSNINSETNELGTIEVKNFSRIESIEINGNKIDFIEQSVFHIDVFLNLGIFSINNMK